MSNIWQYKPGNPEYEKYMHSSEWRKTADKRLDMDSYVCCVCGGKATDVHHLTYESFRHESMDDLVSLCRRCHNQAELFYDPTVTPWAMDEIKPQGNNFMAAMRTDACQLAPKVYEYLISVKGTGFRALMTLRQPNDEERRRYWDVLHKAVYALCRKRYSKSCLDDRSDMMIFCITNHTVAHFLSVIEHHIRNAVQSDLHNIVNNEYRTLGNWKAVSEKLGIGTGTTRRLRSDDGSSFGPSLREAVMFFCGIDAVAGIKPAQGFTCLNEEDYKQLNNYVDYMTEVSGDEKNKGGEEYYA